MLYCIVSVPGVDVPVDSTIPSPLSFFDPSATPGGLLQALGLTPLAPLPLSADEEDPAGNPNPNPDPTSSNPTNPNLNPTQPNPTNPNLNPTQPNPTQHNSTQPNLT